jgi:diguanylate cyclase (GGDEF)-like protein/PAS domain S-box-containing protein
LEAAERRSRALLASLPEGVFYKSVPGLQFASANETFAAQLGATARDLIGKHVKDVLPPDWARTRARQDEDVLRSGATKSWTEKVTLKGQIRLLKVTKTPVHDSAGETAGILGVCTDITAEHRAREAIWASEEKYRLISENASDMISLHEPRKQEFLFANPAALETLGYSEEELLGTSLLELVHPQDREHAVNRLAELASRGESSAEFRVKKRDGTYIWVEAVGRVAHDPNDRAVALLVARDITDKVRRREELRALSLRDPLTGVHNRRGFFLLAEQQLKVAERTRSQLVLLFLDVDRMKWINDTHGHRCGDQALVETTNVLRDVFRESDIIGRIGGDEFAVLAIQAELQQADEVLSRIDERLAVANQNPDRRFDLSFSVGVTAYDPDDPVPLYELISRADALMYRDKRTHRGA